ncbi:MAG: ABC transporter permease, partial [Acidimicrobiia bacterium]
MRQAVAVAAKELRQILRDQRSLMILLVIPAFFLLIFGYALNFDIRHVSLAVQDKDRSTQSRELVSAFVNSGYFSLVGYIDAPAELDRLVDEGHVRAILSIPSGLERDLGQRRPVTVQGIIDGDNANTASTVMGYARRLVAENSAAVSVTGARARGPGIGVEPRIWYNPQLRSTLFLVPGLIAYIAMITAVVSTALSVVREKERGTMEQVRMAPI